MNNKLKRLFSKLRSHLKVVLRYLKLVPQKLGSFSRKSLLIGVYAVVIIALAGFLLTRGIGAGIFTQPETEIEEEKEDRVINVDEIFEGAEEQRDELMKEDGVFDVDEDLPKDEADQIQEDQETEMKEPENKGFDEKVGDKEKNEKDVEEKEVQVTSPADIPEGIWPVRGEILTSHGELYQIENQYRFHNGIDIEAPKGKEVIAAWGGEVVAVNDDTALGLKIVMKSEGFSATYANLEKSLVREGDWIDKGEKIATVGESARLDASEGSYLHFAVLMGDKNVDPKEVLSNGSH